MPRRRAPSEQARIAEFANVELQQIVDDLSTERNFETSKVALLGALVITARQLPLDLVQALIPSYVARERDELARLPEQGDEGETRTDSL